MKDTRTQKFILYSLGAWFEEANKKIRHANLAVSISKALFIDLALKAGFAKKQKRAFYKNLEILEKKKLLKYENKELELTPRGTKHYEKIKKDIGPYLNVYLKLQTKNPTSYTRKVQTIFR